MSDTQAAMREFRFLEEKRSRGELSDAEAHRWHELREALGFPPVDAGYGDPNAYAQQQQYGYYASDGNWYPYPLDAYGRPYDPNYPPADAYGYAAAPGEYPVAPGYAAGYDPAAYAQPATTPGWTPAAEGAPGGDDFAWSETTQASAPPQGTPWPGGEGFSNDELGALGGDFGLEDTHVSARPAIPPLGAEPTTQTETDPGPVRPIEMQTQPEYPRPTGHLSASEPSHAEPGAEVDGSEPTLAGSPLFPEPTAAELEAEALAQPAVETPAGAAPEEEPAPAVGSPFVALSTPITEPSFATSNLVTDPDLDAPREATPPSEALSEPEPIAALDAPPLPANVDEPALEPAAEVAPEPSAEPEPGVAEPGPEPVAAAPFEPHAELPPEPEPELAPAVMAPAEPEPSAASLSEPEETAPPAAEPESLFGAPTSFEQPEPEAAPPPTASPSLEAAHAEPAEAEVLELAETDVALVDESPSEAAPVSPEPAWRAELPAAPAAPTDWAPPVPHALAVAPPAEPEPVAAPPASDDDEVMELDASDLQPVDDEPEPVPAGQTEWGAVPEPDLPVLDLGDSDLSGGAPVAPPPTRAPRTSPTVELSAELQRELSEGLEDDGPPLVPMAESVNASAFDVQVDSDASLDLSGASDDAVDVVSPSEFMISVTESPPIPPPAPAPAAPSESPFGSPDVLAGEEEAEVDWNEPEPTPEAVPPAAAPPPPPPEPLRTRSLEVDLSDLEGRFTPLEVPATRRTDPPRSAAGSSPTLELPIVEAPPERGGSNAFVPGEHRVIIHTLEGLVKRGVLRDVDLLDASIPLEEQMGAAPERIPTERLKAIFFMAPAGSRPPSNVGRKVRVTFKDGRQVAGFSDDFQNAEHGFFVVPADNRTNTARIYIFRASIQGVAEG